MADIEQSPPYVLQLAPGVAGPFAVLEAVAEKRYPVQSLAPGVDFVVPMDVARYGYVFGHVIDLLPDASC
uniref:Uncharacterized protein n=1 Tax=viral metagenome TaxID=1070528 RepID=A0A6M3JK14_9ZZZZ